MKKLTAIILLACLFFMLGGYHILYYLQIEDAKSEMRERILNSGDKNAIEFSFDRDQAKQLSWNEESEFSYNGEMYDVVEKHEDHGKLVIRCLADKNEEKLVAQYRNTNKENTDNGKTRCLYKIISTQFICVSVEAMQTPVKEINSPTANYISSCPAPANAILIPPPRVC